MRNFSRSFYTQIKLSKLRDCLLRMREDGPLISKARNSTQINADVNFFFFLLSLAALGVEEEYHKYAKADETGQVKRNAVFSAECTIGMVRGLTPLKHYGAMALRRYGAIALLHYGTMAIRCKL